MMFLVLFSAWAYGATLDVFVHGVARGHAVEVLAEGTGEWVSVSCQDRGTGRDAAVDGSWTCPALEVSAAAGRITALVDGMSFQPMAIDFVDGPLHLRKRGRLLKVVTEAAAPVQGAVAAGPAMILLVRLTARDASRAPLVIISNAAGQRDLVCRDDGASFDAQPNDSEYLCTGWLPGPSSSESISTDFAVRGEIGSERALGTLSFQGGAGLRFAQLDTTGELAPSSASFRLPVSSSDPPPRSANSDPIADDPSRVKVVTHPPVEHDLMEHGPLEHAPLERAPVERAPAEHAPVEHAPVEHDMNPLVEVVAPPPVLTGRTGPMSAVLTVFALILGGFVGWRVRSLRRAGLPLPRQLKIVPFRPAATDGPSADGPPIVVCAEDPQAAARALMERLTSHRRVVVLAPDEMETIPGVYRCRSDDVDDLVDAVRQLVDRDGLPVAVVIRGRDTLKNRSVPTPDPLIDGLDALAAMAWTAVVLDEEESLIPGRALWRVDAGGRWVSG